VSSPEGELGRRAAASDGVRPSTPEDGPAIVALMRSVGLEPHSDPQHLHWKYWQERADWPGPRSFVLTAGRELLAHIALVPGALRSRGARMRAIHLIDWAARRDSAGVGVRLAKSVSRMSDCVFAVGGSGHTRRLLPLMGYARWGSVLGYARPLSALAILRRPVPARWKLVPRMTRSLFWSLAAPRADNAGWRVRRLGVEEIDQVREALPTEHRDLAVLERSPALLRHALACPIVPMELYGLERGGRVAGYFLLGYAPGQARIADMWIASEDPADWRALIQAAVQQAGSKGGLAEIIVWSSDPNLSPLLEACGFHKRLSWPIYLKDSVGAVKREDIMRVQMLDSDAFYLYFGGNELWA
jgi:hypothetical protein